MKVAESRLTPQGQIPVPVEIRRRLGLAPGSVIEWSVENDVIFVRKSTRHTSTDIHEALFPDGPPEPHTLDEIREGVCSDIVKRHARG